MVAKRLESEKDNKWFLFIHVPSPWQRTNAIFKCNDSSISRKMYIFRFEFQRMRHYFCIFQNFVDISARKHEVDEAMEREKI